MKQEFEEGKKEVNNYLKYSGIGFQIVGIAVAGFFLGQQIDKWTHNSKPYFTALLAFLFLAAGMYTTFKNLLKKPW